MKLFISQTLNYIVCEKEESFPLQFQNTAKSTVNELMKMQ